MSDKAYQAWSDAIKAGKASREAWEAAKKAHAADTAARTGWLPQGADKSHR